MFDIPDFKNCLERLERQQVGGPDGKYSWAVQWAQNKVSGIDSEVKKEAEDRDEDRRTLTRFLFALCDTCFEKIATDFLRPVVLSKKQEAERKLRVRKKNHFALLQGMTCHLSLFSFVLFFSVWREDQMQ